MTRAEQIAALADGTRTAGEIASLIKSTTWAVQKCAHRHGIPLPPRGRPRTRPLPDARRKARQEAQNARRRVGAPEPGLQPRSAPVLPQTLRWRCACTRLVEGASPCPGCGQPPPWTPKERAA